MSIIRKAQEGLAAEQYVRQQMGLDPAAQQAAFQNEVGQATQALMGNASPQGLAEMGMSPEAIQTAMQGINNQSLSALNQRQAQTGVATIPEQGLAGGY